MTATIRLDAVWNAVPWGETGGTTNLTTTAHTSRTSHLKTRYHQRAMLKGSRAVLVLAALGLVLAWLAAAADRQPAVPHATSDQPSAAHARAGHLAQDIRDQARRLRSQL